MNNDYLGYMAYRQEVEDIVELCGEAIAAGDDYMEILSNFDLDSYDLEKIRRELDELI